MNKRNLELLRLPSGIRGAPVCVVDTGFDPRTVPGINQVGETKVDLHGTCVAWIIRELANPIEIHCFARGWTRLNEAVRYCVEHGIKLINCSLSDARLSAESINLCLQHNILIIKSAGNEGDDGVTKPAEVDSVVMAVAAFEEIRNAIDGDSSRGPEVDVAAPSNWQIILYNGNKVPFTDTSSAAPVITAALSKYLALRPGATIEQRKEFIFSNARDIEQPGRDDSSGHGLFVWPEKLEVSEPVNWQKIILHHTATSTAASVDDIRRYHIKERGWDDIGYHFLVDVNGNVYLGRPLDKPGAHAVGYNDIAIGVAAIGNFDVYEMGEVQKQAIIKKVKELMQKHNIPASEVDTHRGVANTACPGKYFPEKEIKAALKAGPFSDVPAGHWAAASVAKAKERGILDGYKDGTFRGTETVTRYELADALVSLHDAVLMSIMKAMKG